MTESDVNAILVAQASMDARLSAKLDHLVEANKAADLLHQDHEKRLRALEQVRWILLGLALAAGGTGGTLLTKALGG